MPGARILLVEDDEVLCELILRNLEIRGHDVRVDVGGYGGYQAIKIEMHDGQRVYVGASESRKDGQAAGY